jgi:hypothetical protein
VDADLLVHPAKHPVVHHAAQDYGGRGRPRLHGAPLRLADVRTHGRRQRSACLAHPFYRTVQIDVWTDLHMGGAPDAPFSVVRVQAGSAMIRWFREPRHSPAPSASGSMYGPSMSKSVNASASCTAGSVRLASARSVKPLYTSV